MHGKYVMAESDDPDIKLINNLTEHYIIIKMPMVADGQEDVARIVPRKGQ